jgi:hypothetical protein
MGPHVNLGGVVDRLVSVMSYSKWQTSAIIACQLTFPPDALARALNYDSKHKRTVDPATDAVSRTLSRLYFRGKVERRLTDAGVFEYRLSSAWADKCKTYIQRIKHDAYHKGYVRKSEYSNQKRFAEITATLVLRGILVEESDGNFLLNPNISKECKSSECT